MTKTEREMLDKLRDVYRKRHPEWASMPNWKLNGLIRRFGIGELYAQAEYAGDLPSQEEPSSRKGST